MKKVEKDEIKRLPSKYKPISAWGYFGYNILFSLPVIGFILLIIFACIDHNINLRSYARSHFCGLLIGLIVVGIIVAIGFATGMFQAYIATIQELMQQMGQQG